MTTQDHIPDPVVELDQLREALTTLPVIEQAKGMIMLLCHLSADEAFIALRTISQHTNVKLHDVAAVIGAAGSRTEQTLDADIVHTVLAETRKSVLGRAFIP